MNETLDRIRTFRLSEAELEALTVWASERRITTSAAVRALVVGARRGENFTLRLASENNARLEALQGEGE